MQSIVLKTLFLVSFLGGGHLAAQLFSDPFDADLAAWTAIGAWSWDANGAAEGSPDADWRNRSRIQSASRGGAALFAGPEQDGQLLSTIIDVPAAVTEVYLSFYQYYRSNGGGGRVRILAGGVEVRTFPLTTGLEADDESSAGNFILLDLSDLLAIGINAFQIEFDVEGATRFWLLDDVNVSTTRPARPTFPRYFGEALSSFGIPYIVDERGAPAVPRQLVADFLPGVTEAERADFRDAFGARLLRSCVCDRLEVWEMPGGLFFDATTGEPLGNPSEILQNTLPGMGMNKVDGLDLNYYSYNDLQALNPGPNLPLTAEQVASFPLGGGGLKVAILDTGIDLDHPDFNGMLYRDTDGVGDNSDNDQDCYPDNPLGWNFVDDNNNPEDNNGHGTHVSGIVADLLRDCDDCQAQILPYKTHDSHGVGTLFASACAVLQAAVNDGATIINASWGFYGGGSTILRSAIDTAGNYGAVLIAAAGNDSLNLVADRQYPATYELPNVLCVGAAENSVTDGIVLAAFSNYGSAFVDLAADGVDIESSVPGGGRGLKSGTSMATPAVSAAAALYACSQDGRLGGALAFLMKDANKERNLVGVQQGNYLNLEGLCPGVVDEEIDQVGGIFTAFANADFSKVTVRALVDLPGALVGLYGPEQTLLDSQRPDSFTRGSEVVFAISTPQRGNYLLTVRAGGRTWTQRLVNR
ncbi:S8 family serine peptidase [Neolewinella lacunae]|uniref:S8 family serine peptidase n=1 Tax=Neolewinella lacunae TaxID=1517758 RepID=A0A923TBG9_9BACT|nr:S8 family serine peptidase [Neolewinella lacunae]MBC6992577.1 S8 family serine peptidase [Neolewinella lacunae]MDN3634318.1 S8 family serine peptidase [Neolewinella lacunae]